MRYKIDPTARILIVQAPYYKEITDNLCKGAMSLLKAKRLRGIEKVNVAGALEIPVAIKLASRNGYFDGFIALGCVIRGETSHYDIVAGESARGLMDLSLKYNLVIGNGIITCENMDQAIVRADPEQKNKGGEAAHAVLSLLELRDNLEQTVAI